MSLEECRIIEIPSFSDSRGDLCVLEKGDVLPFEIKRIFYTYNVPRPGAYCFRPEYGAFNTGIPRERYCSCWRRNVMMPRIISGGMKIIWSM